MMSRRPTRRGEHSHAPVAATQHTMGPQSLHVQRPLEAAQQHEHCVLLYEDDAYLLSAILSWTEDGLRAGEGVILVARTSLCDRVRAGLRQADMDPAGFEATGRLRLLDADRTLRLFMVRGLPQANLFQNAIAPILEDVKKASPAGAVRAWGEMVDLLWKRAQGPAAQQLEELWNGLIATHVFRLFCAYQVDAFDTLQFPKIRAIAQSHGIVLPAENEARLATAVDAALNEVYGPEADAVRSFLSSNADPKIPLPFHRILALHALAPDFAAIVAARAGLAYRGGPA